MTDEPLMHIKDAAHMFGVSRNTMAGWLDNPERGFETALDEHGTRKVTRTSVEAVHTRVKARSNPA